MNKGKYISQLVIALGLVLAINWLASLVFWRVDLTADKRFTLSEVTTEFLSEEIQQPLEVDFYLDGSINTGFGRLEKATLNMLKQFQTLNGKHITFEHIIIDKINDEAEKDQVVNGLSTMGLSPMNVIDEDNNGKRIQKAVYPWAVVSYNGRQRAIKLLVNTSGRSGEQNLNSSIEGLEYQFTEAFRLLTDTLDSRIAFIEGHGELGDGETYDITTSLSHYYSVDRGQIGDDASILENYKAIIIAQPTQEFTEKEKYVIDQYIMNGGKALWLVDGVTMSIDSLSKAGNNYGIYNKINLSDMLFRYGVRINPDLIQDLQCALYPVNIANHGEQARYQPLPLLYSPLLMPNQNHPISRNISNVKGEFVSTLDLVGNEEVKKTVLLTTSPRSKVMPVPVEIDMSLAVENMEVEEFNAGLKPVAVLLEGEFPSVFANRITPKELFNTQAHRKASVSNRMIVIADGSMIENDLRGGANNEVQVVPLGFDYATGQDMFGNKDFLLNAVNYLTDDAGWFKLRQRSIDLRLLDKEQMERRQYYRILNVGSPLLLLLLLSLILMMVRKKRYNK